MTVTDQQLRALAFLAPACRPNGAKRWDSAGVMAALEKVRDRSLPEVVMAVVRAAADRNVDTPGVIPSAGTHWQETAAVRAYVPDSAPAGVRCTTCGRAKHRGNEDHEFRLPRAAADVTEAWREAREEVVPARQPTKPPPTPELCGLDDCQRGAGHSGPHLPPVTKEDEK